MSFAWAAGPTGGSVVTANQLPSGGSVSAGAASFTVQGNVLTVNNSAGAVINWQDFSIGSNARANFVQPSASSAVLNRVVGGNPSSIMGVLQSNGRVFITNPNGTLISPSATINTAGFTATTSEISNSDFVAGRTDWSGVGSLFSINGQVTGSTIRVSSNGIEVSDLTPEASASVALQSAGTVTLTTQRAVLDWQQFSIGSGSVVFNGGSGSVALNRVVVSNPSAIVGSLQNNGNVFLINPSGITFPSSTGVTLVQSSLTNLSSTAGWATGSVRTTGAINVSTGGTTVLNARDVTLAGTQAGAVSISTAGNTTLIADGGRGSGSANVTIAGSSVANAATVQTQSAGAQAATPVGMIAAASGTSSAGNPARAVSVAPSARIALHKREPIY